MVNQGHRVCNVELLEDGIMVTSEHNDESHSSRFDRVIVAVPLEQAAEIGKQIDLEIEGRSLPCIVAWGPCETPIEHSQKVSIFTRWTK